MLLFSSCFHFLFYNWDFFEFCVYLQAVPAGNFDHKVSAIGCPANPQYCVTFPQQSLGDGMENFIEDIVANLF